MFFEHLGFYGEDLKLARLERDIDQKGKTEAFRAAYRKITGTEWLDERDAYDLNSDAVIDALEQAGAKSREAAERWFDNTEEFEFTIDWLVRQINQYVSERAEQEGGEFRLLFMVDEVGQYIGTDTSLMLNLQTIVEDLGAQCAGRVWVVVTSQEAIDEITTVAGQDFSKIQGRFNTRLSLSSTGAGEVIRRRILSKNEHAHDLLTVEYGKNATVLKNLFTFKGARNDLGGYDGAGSFADAFPFVGYQFKLMQDVINGLRNQGSSGKHLSAERSMLSGFQEVAQALEDRDEHALAPLWMFYNTVQSFLEGYHRRVIDRAAAAARDGAGLEEYDVAVLKLLFLIKWVSQEMPGNVDNIATPHGRRSAHQPRRGARAGAGLTRAPGARELHHAQRRVLPVPHRRRAGDCPPDRAHPGGCGQAHQEGGRDRVRPDLRDAEDHRRQEQLPRGGMAGRDPREQRGRPHPARARPHGRQRRP